VAELVLGDEVQLGQGNRPAVHSTLGWRRDQVRRCRNRTWQRAILISSWLAAIG
jgi:hypothetical protein